MPERGPLAIWRDKQGALGKMEAVKIADELLEEFGDVPITQDAVEYPQPGFLEEALSLRIIDLLPNPKRHALGRHGIKTLRDLTQVSEFELRRIPRVGKVTVSRLKIILEDRGLSLKPSER